MSIIAKDFWRFAPLEPKEAILIRLKLIAFVQLLPIEKEPEDDDLETKY